MQDETAPNVNNVSGLLKAFVILGAVVLVIGMLLLAVMIIIRVTTGSGPGAGDAPGRELASSGPVDLALPAGVRVEQVVVDGKRLVLLGEGPDGQQYIAVVDADVGERRSLIRVAPEE